jgi:DNA-binding NarL/FixJ family response regulator
MEKVRVLVVEDDRELLDQMKQSLEACFGDDVEIRPEHDFDTAIDLLRCERFDVVILDVRRGEPNSPLGDSRPEAGRRCFDEVRKVRFVPVVFHTGLPESVRDLESSVVSIVQKGGPPTALLDAVQGVLQGGLPKLARAMISHVERVQREYMWDFGAKAWALYRKEKPDEVVHLLARRLALSFESAGIDELLEQVPEIKSSGDSNGLNPVRMYVFPPLNHCHFRTGDIFVSSTAPDLYLVLLTPTCDIVPRKDKGTEQNKRKVDAPVLACCKKVSEFQEFSDWVGSGKSKGKKDALRKLLTNNRNGEAERYFYLPSVFELPDLVADLSDLCTKPLADLGSEQKFRHIATLDEPFAASLLTKFLRYFGRFGTADLDVDLVLSRLEKS